MHAKTKGSWNHKETYEMLCRNKKNSQGESAYMESKFTLKFTLEVHYKKQCHYTSFVLSLIKKLMEIKKYYCKMNYRINIIYDLVTRILKTSL